MLKKVIAVNFLLLLLILVNCKEQDENQLRTSSKPSSQTMQKLEEFSLKSNKAGSNYTLKAHEAVQNKGSDLIELNDLEFIMNSQNERQYQITAATGSYNEHEKTIQFNQSILNSSKQDLSCYSFRLIYNFSEEKLHAKEVELSYLEHRFRGRELIAANSLKKFRIHQVKAILIF